MNPTWLFAIGWIVLVAALVLVALVKIVAVVDEHRVKQRDRRGVPTTPVEQQAFRAMSDISATTMGTIQGIRQVTEEKIARLLTQERDGQGGS